MSAPADAGSARSATRPAAGDDPAVEEGSGEAGRADDLAPNLLRDELRRLAAEGNLAGEGRLEPPPLTEIPPHDRYCDLVLTGGVASGVAYPWAVVELARHYRFRQIGGTSVGAVAAALAAASEYGRCRNVSAPFEVMRRLPLELAAPSPSGQPTTLLGLFQPAAGGQRLFRLLVELLTLMSRSPQDRPDPARAQARPVWQRLLLKVLHAGPVRPPLAATAAEPGPDPDSDALQPDGLRPLTPLETLGFALRVLRAYLRDARVLGFRKGVALAWRFLRQRPVMALVGVLALWGLATVSLALAAGVVGALVGIGTLVLLVLGLVQAVQRDLREGIVDNDMGLCRGLKLPGARDPGIVDWMHEGIQRAAGLRVGDAPLTFRDLWDAPQPFPGVPGDRHIRLEMMVTNITLGRPYRFPLEGAGDRLWYRPEEWTAFFPPSVLQALEKASRPYCPRSDSDPADPGVIGARELPVADLPIVVAARMSMSFPILFSCVPVYAMDYEPPRERRRLRPCQLSDGGLCSNFPIHLFDAAIPRWPTFGLWLTRRLKDFPEQGVWLPRTHLEGRADSFRDHLDRASGARPVARLARFGLGVVSTMKDWGDHTRIRLPHVRNRVARIRLRPGEGELFITMPAAVIRRMAWTYGTEAGRKLVAAFGADPQTGAVATAWRDHLYVRLQVLLVGLRELLKGVEQAAASRAHTLPLEELLQRVSTEPVALAGREKRSDPAGRALQPAQVSVLEDALAALTALEAELGRTAAADLPYRPSPQPELRLRPPL